MATITMQVFFGQGDVPTADEVQEYLIEQAPNIVGAKSNDQTSAFGRQIALLRKKRGLTRATVAGLTRIHPGFLVLLEVGAVHREQITEQVIEALEKALGGLPFKP